MSKRLMTAAAAAVATLTGAASSRAALVGQWIGDNYTANASTWADSSGNSRTATAVTGSAIATQANAFGTHKGVVFAGGDGASAAGFFTVPNSATAPAVLGATAITWAAVVKPAAAGTSNGGQFWQKSGLIGNEQGGDVSDWGFGFGASQADVGVGGTDTTLTSPAVTLNAPHVLVGQWNGTGGTLRLYVDGVLAASQTTGVPSAARTDTNTTTSFALGSTLGTQNGDTHVFNGQVAELRLYNDATTDPVALSTALANTYAVPEPGTVGLLAFAGFALLGRRRRAVT